LRAFPPEQREHIRQDWEEQKDPLSIMVLMSNQQTLRFVFDNMLLFHEHGIYEKALLDAFIGCRVNWATWSPDVIHYMFERGDKEKLHSYGDPLPDKNVFTLYRGVAGVGRARRVRGFSWTANPHCAAWFATRFCDLPNPTVFTIECPREYVLAHLGPSFRNEEEYLILPYPDMKPKKVEPMPDKEVWSVQQKGGIDSGEKTDTEENGFSLSA
jgi:hypothetical protein